MLALALAAALLSQHNLRTIDHEVQDPSNITFGVNDFRMDGFAGEINAYYRRRSVHAVRPDAHLRVTVPHSGRYYPAILIYDAAGEERYEISTAGGLLGTAVADWDNARQRLFYLPQAVSLGAGQEIDVRATGRGNHRVENILLLRDKPQPEAFSFEFREVGWFEGTLVWRTNWAAACTLEFDRRIIREDSPQNNHRAVLNGIEPGTTHRYRITARTFDGSLASTGWRTVQAPAATVPHSTATGTIPLTVEASGGPVSSGVPFPPGVLGSDSHLRLLDAAGRQAPLQTRTLARWKDGSVKWVLLDFQASASGYRLEYGPTVRHSAPSVPVRVREDSSGVTVSTGPLDHPAPGQTGRVLPDRC